MLNCCAWADRAELRYQQYHDQEWGKLNLDERYLYEMLVLETAQAGLSWRTVLQKRAHYRQAFANFDVNQVAKFGASDYQRLMQDPGLIRNRLKIKAAIHNAQVVVRLHQNHETLAGLLQALVPKVIVNYPQTIAEVPTQTPLSAQVARAMQQRGFKFIGPTTSYAYLQAVGLINDHIETCSFKYR